MAKAKKKTAKKGSLLKALLVDQESESEKYIEVFNDLYD